MKTLISNATVISCHDAGHVQTHEGQSILLDGPKIVAVAPDAELRADPAASDVAETFDAADYLVIPGLVNTHHHLFQSITRGLKPVQSAKLFDWLTQLYLRWQHLSYDAVKLAAQVSLGELLLSGCTTTSDHFYMYPPRSSVRFEAVIEAADSLGIRIHLCRGSMSVGQSLGGLPPDNCVEDEADIMKDMIRCVDSWHDTDELAMHRVDLAPCSPFNISPELFRDTAIYARERKLLLHTHAAETMDEEAYCLDRFGMRPIPYLESCGWLGEDVYLAHCVHLSEADIDLMVQHGTAVAHCPCSNMRLGSGAPPIRKLLDRGVRLGLGVDGSSSNDGGHLLAEARQMLLLQRVMHGADAVSPAEVFRTATWGGAKVLRRPALGRIAPGMAADLAMYRADDIALAGAVGQDPLAALTLCHVGRADRVIVHGRTVVRDGRLVQVDEQRLARSLNDLAKRSFR